MNFQKQQSIIPAPESVKDFKSKRLVLLDPSISEEIIPENTAIQEFIKQTKAEIMIHKLKLDYDFWTSEQILRAVLPKDLDVPVSYTLVGHIAHFNLKPEYEPYKQLIGQVLLDKIKNIETVVNKLSTIDTKFRVFDMELLAGNPEYLTIQKESDCKFKFDFSKVYWNSRLQQEHKRLFSTFKNGEIVMDVMAGVGPFAIPAAKNGVFVFANDLNPSSFEYLTENIQMNKVKSNCKSFNLDGRDFIRNSVSIVKDDVVWEDFIKESTILSKTRRFAKEPMKIVEKPLDLLPQHYVMNLPDTAIEFLDAFQGLFTGIEIADEKLPLIHVYCFSKADDTIKDTIDV